MSKQDKTNQARFTPNRIRPVERRWTLARLPSTTIDRIDAEAAKWRISRAEAITRLVAVATAQRTGVAA